MKKYIAFGFPSYYPSGGLGDIIGSFDTIEEAKAAITFYENQCVVDRDTWEIVWENQ